MNSQKPGLNPAFQSTGLLLMERYDQETSRANDLSDQAARLVGEYRARRIGRMAVLELLEGKMKTVFDKIQADEAISEELKLYLANAILEQGLCINDLKAAN